MKPRAFRAHLLKYAELYERARDNPPTSTRGLNTKQRALARAKRIARLQRNARP